MGRRTDYAKLNAHERELGLPITKAPPPRPPNWAKRHSEGLEITGIFLAIITAFGGFIIGIMAIDSAGLFAGPDRPPPPLPKHAYVYHGRPYGFFVVDHGYGYLSHILCRYGGGENEPKIAPMPSGQELVTCMEAGGPPGEPFTYNAAQEYVE